MDVTRSVCVAGFVGCLTSIVMVAGVVALRADDDTQSKQPPAAPNALAKPKPVRTVPFRWNSTEQSLEWGALTPTPPSASSVRTEPPEQERAQSLEWCCALVPTPRGGAVAPTPPTASGVRSEPPEQERTKSPEDRPIAPGASPEHVRTIVVPADQISSPSARPVTQQVKPNAEPRPEPRAQVPDAQQQPVGNAIDCGPRPSLACLAPYIFELAKTLPESRGLRNSVRFAEQELAPGSKDVALRYFLWDGPDSAPWQGIDWIARAGRFDRAIKLVNGADTPLQKAGGLIAIADRLAATKHMRRSAALLDRAEALLPTIENELDYKPILVRDAAQVRARIGHFRRVARLLHRAETGDIDELLLLAQMYPLNGPNLRRRAWTQAGHTKEPYVWRRLLEDAAERGDTEGARLAAHS
jgi:hypothetical protein